MRHAHEILFITITGTQLFAKYREISLDKILTGFSMGKKKKKILRHLESITSEAIATQIKHKAKHLQAVQIARKYRA